MLRLADLALRSDMQLGSMLVSPSRRLVEGPGGHAHLEPLIMQVFLLLLDAGGKVVTRTELFDQCWGGVMVGDDSLNRTIAKVRRTGEQVAPGLFEIETIPRTGYRLTGAILRYLSNGGAQASSLAAAGRGVSRRLMLSGAAATTLAGAGGFWWAVRSQSNSRFNALMERGEQAVNYVDPSTSSAPYFEKAIAIRSGSAKAHGLLAYSLALGVRGPGEAGGAGTTMQNAERAAQLALGIDRNEPYARVALILLQRPLLDLATAEDRLREVLATAPDNIVVMRHLWGLLQSAGRSRDAFALVERALAIAPLAAGNHYPMAQMLWILGRTAEADRVIGRAIELWPSHRFVRFARFIILAFTDRPRAALAMIENKETRPQQYSPEAVSLWRVSLAALDQRSPPTIAAARQANLAAARQTPELANQAVLAMSALGEVDAAFEAADRLLLFRTSAAPGANARSSGRLPAKSTAWGFTPWLFVPPTASLRADPRFKSLCDGIGLTEYWVKRGIKPDYQLGIT